MSATPTSARRPSRCRNSPTWCWPAPPRSRAKRCWPPTWATACGCARRSAAREHTMLFDTGTEGAVFIRNCRNLGLDLGTVEEIAITHGHWDHMGALPAAIDAIVEAARPRRGDGARQSRHVQRTRRAPEERHHLPRRPRADAAPDGGARRQGRQRRQGAPAARRPFLLQRRDPARQLLRERPARTISAARTTRRNGGPIPT